MAFTLIPCVTWPEIRRDLGLLLDEQVGTNEKKAALGICRKLLWFYVALSCRPVDGGWDTMLERPDGIQR